MQRSDSRANKRELDARADLSPQTMTITPVERDQLGVPIWFGAQADELRLLAFGFRLAGGGAHQSKTMMLEELEALLRSSSTNGEALKLAAIEENALGKSTVNSRRLTFGHLTSLYGLMEQPPLTRALFKLWKSDPDGHRLQALLVSLARDPLLRETAKVVLSQPVGQILERPLFEEALSAAFPSRFSEKMVRSMAQNCASSWSKSGHLQGFAKKVRRRILPTPSTVALAALLATVSGFGGPAILSSGWMKALDLSVDQALDSLRRAEAIGLARVRSTGDVTEILVRQAMASTLGVKELEHV
ncbi:hypothetical protein [Bradyrhizobium sp. URHA0013]|uniref:hypothetical protein n=1 Tax=Bradyrhizobium sp. URHA0013 TaxID=1380352 RepID=UPI000683F2EC|nr:hypothetical protein [Bradyrhizobium sp. URHA0013]